MDGKFFARFIHNKLQLSWPSLKKCAFSFVIDNDPSQTSHLALQVMEETAVHFLSIPPRSPTPNPIQIRFHLVRLALRKGALDKNINNETIEEFEARIEYQLKSVSLEVLKKTISTMKKQLRMKKNNNGYQTKY